MNVRAKSPTRRSRSRLLKRKSPKRKSPNRKSPKRKSPNRKSPTRRSPTRRSPKRKSPKRKSPKRRSPKRRSPKRGSPKRKSRSRHNMLKGGTKEEKRCDLCHEYVAEKDGVEGTGKNRIGFWIHNKDNEAFCKETVHKKKMAHELKERVNAEIIKRARAKAVAMENYKDKKKYQNAIEKVRREMEIENERVDALSDHDQEREESGDFFPIPHPETQEQAKIIFDERRNRYAYRKNQTEKTNREIKNLRDLMLYDESTQKVLIVYSVASINKTNPRWTIPNPYSIEIHCTTFRPENNTNEPPQNFYGHVSLNIHRGIDEDTNTINSENYHYGIYNKDGKITSFTRQFWSNKKLITKPEKLIFIDDGKNSHLAFLFPTISAGDLMIQYYNWCIRTCPESVIPFSLDRDTFKRLTRWGFEPPHP